MAAHAEATMVTVRLARIILPPRDGRPRINRGGATTVATKWCAIPKAKLERLSPQVTATAMIERKMPTAARL